MERNTEVDLPKARTGIKGFDGISRGGLPAGRTTTVLGTPGTGKTVFALHTLVNGARDLGEPGIFVAFEEGPEAIAANARGFGWDLDRLGAEDKLRLVDARLSPHTITSGAFDLHALLATVGSQARAMGARRIVFDAIDVLLTVLDSPAGERTELHRIRDWLADSGLTGLITLRLPDRPGCDEYGRYSFVQYMADCVVRLEQEIVDRVALRSLRILKYRGSGFSANEYPVVIDRHGFRIAAFGVDAPAYPVFTERVSSGVERFDTMLRGGYYRGSSVLVTGSPGTAKTTLCATFIDAACRRGERALFVAFDENPEEIVRNQRSVGIDLQSHVDAGLLRMAYLRSEACSADEHLAAIETLLQEQVPTCMVVDPLSAMLKAGGRLAAMPVSMSLIQLTKTQGITLVSTSLTADSPAPATEGAELHISTIADTWLNLSFAIQGGERNRALTIVKARGIGHSRQVRELVLSDAGVTLADVYSAGGEVLMGTLRLEKELSDQLEKERLRGETEARRRELEASQFLIEAQATALQRELEAKRGELETLQQQSDLRDRHWDVLRERVETQRGADPTAPQGEAEP